MDSNKSFWTAFSAISAAVVAFFATLGCQSNGSEGFFYGSLGREPKLIVTSSTSVTASPFMLVQYSIDGVFEKVLYDSTFENRLLRSMAMIDPFNFLISTDTVDGILQYNVFNGISTFVASGSLSGNLFTLRRATNGDVFVIETTFIESFDSAGGRIGNPRINTTTGSCVMNGTVRGMDIDSSGTLIVASQGNDDLLFYDVSNPSSTTCVTANQTMGNIDPIGVVAHTDGSIYVATANGTDSIYRFNGDGSGSGTSIYTMAAATNPTAMIQMPDGSLLIANDGNNNIIKIDTSGNVVAYPFIQDGFTLYVQDMMILEAP
ncbi:MAG: hypothetical protein AB7F86_10345 [Bdellovibrionales bacterium]